MDQTACDEMLTGGWLEERMVRCGWEGCRCARGHLHGPYVYLADRLWDEQAGRWRVRRRYVRKQDVPEVRRVLCAAKEANRDILRLLRDNPRIVAELELQELTRARQLLPRLRRAAGRSHILLRLLTAAAKPADPG